MSGFGRRAAALAALALGFLGLLPMAAEASSWHRAETAHVVIYTDLTAEAARGYGRLLEDFDAVLRTRYGRPVGEPVQHKLDIYIVRDAADMKRVWPDQPGLLGVYKADEHDTFVVAVRDGGGGGLTGDQNVLHEYAHHFMGQYDAMAYPTWYAEGFADYFGSAEVGRQAIKIGAAEADRIQPVLNKPWISIETLLTANPFDLRGDQGLVFYSMGWLLTHYIMDSSERRADFGRYIEFCRQAHAPAAAWRMAFGQSEAQLAEALRAYAREPMQVISVPRTWQAAKVQVNEVSPGEGAILPESIMLKHPARHIDESRLLKTVRRAKAQYPNDRAVRLTLARAEIAYGSRAAGDAELRGLVAANPRDAEALRLLAGSRAAAISLDPKAIQAEVDTLLAQALEADPDSYQALYAYAQNRTFETDYPSQNTLNAFVRAVQLAPQVPAMRLSAGKAAIARQQYTLARDLLEPAAGSPHDPETAKTASALIAGLSTKLALKTPEAAAVRPGS